MKKKPVFFQSLFLMTLLFLGPRSVAQEQPSTAESAISDLAARLARPLQEAHVTKIIFADLKGPDGQIHPVGRWLADKLSDSVSSQFPGLEVIARPQGADRLNGVDASDDTTKAAERAEKWAHHLGAKLVVTGTFAKVPGGIGISLTALRTRGSQGSVAVANGLVLISNVINALSLEPIPSLTDGIPQAGIGGVGIPQCIYCPPPEYTEEARAAHYQGAVVLRVVVRTDGRAVNIAIVKDPGHGLGMQAVEAVRAWRLKPATGFDGKPVAVSCPIEVTFRLRR